jgi:hypothetical protein
VARLKKERKVSLGKEKVRSYKIILNALIAENQGITQGTVILN